MTSLDSVCVDGRHVRHPYPSRAFLPQPCVSRCMGMACVAWHLIWCYGVRCMDFTCARLGIPEATRPCGDKKHCIRHRTSTLKVSQSMRKGVPINSNRHVLTIALCAFHPEVVRYRVSVYDHKSPYKIL